MRLPTEAGYSSNSGSGPTSLPSTSPSRMDSCSLRWASLRPVAGSGRPTAAWPERRSVKDINPGPASSTPANLTDVGGTLFFSATSAASSSPRGFI